MKNRLVHDALMLVSAVVFNFMVYYGGRLLVQGSPHFCLATPLDGAIPLLSWTILIYWGCYLFWAVNYCLSVTAGRDSGRFLLAHFIGEAVCFVTFVCFPTTMDRPVIAGKGFFDSLLRLTYRVDSADNLLPSIHCFVSWLCWIGVRGDPRIPGWYRKASLLIAVAVCVSTLTVKQHVIADVAAGILLAELSYLCAGGIGRRRGRAGKEKENDL